jgi:hypothetical protein
MQGGVVRVCLGLRVGVVFGSTCQLVDYFLLALS